MQEKKKIGIIGYGYVGKAIGNLFKDHYDVFPYDVNNDNLKKNAEAVYKFMDMTVVSVPTPMGDNGKVDLSIIEDVISKLEVPLILIKSTIPPGTTKKLKEKYPNKHIVFSPEYIGEGKYFVEYWHYPHPTDMKYHNFQIFGGAKEDTSAMIDIFMKVLGPSCRYIQTDSTTAECVKYFENSWGAMKVTFCNEWYEIAKAFGVDYNELRELWVLDGRVEKMHTLVFKDKRGFGGKCYPKDVNGIVKASEEAGYEPNLIKQVLLSNKQFNPIEKCPLADK